jgi:hypothetical protein
MVMIIVTDPNIYLIARFVKPVSKISARIWVAGQQSVWADYLFMEMA